MKLAEIAGLPLIVPGPGNGLRELIDAAAATAGIAIRPEVEINSYSQIMSLIDRGVGYGLLPRMAISRDDSERRFRLWRFDAPSMTRRVYLAYSTDRPLTRAQRAVGQLTWEILRGLVREGKWIAELSEEANTPVLFP